MKNKKKLITTIASLALVGAISIGATLAYLSAQTNPMTNTFTAPGEGKGLSIELREPGWDGYDFGEYMAGDKNPDGQTANPEAENSDQLGINEAKNFAPGSTAAKNPQVKNTSTQDVWVALTINASALPEYVDVNGWDNSAWKIVDNKDGTYVAYYNTKLAPNAETDAVFESVSIDKTVNEVDEVPSYNIVINAYAIQGANIDTVDEAVAGFVQEFPAVFTK